MKPEIQSYRIIKIKVLHNNGESLQDSHIKKMNLMIADSHNEFQLYIICFFL